MLIGGLDSFRPAGVANDPTVLGKALDPSGEATVRSAGALIVATDGSHGEAAGTTRTICLLDGTIANLPTLAASLGLDPDTPPEQAIALGFERFAATLLDRLEGSYALLVWDQMRQRGLLACDRLASRPLYLVGGGRGLLFASEIRLLLDALPSRPAPDSLALVHWLTRRRGPPELTLFEGVRRLPAGHCVELSEDGYRIRRWWSPRYRPPVAKPMEVAAAELRDQMTQAVGRSLGEARLAAVTLSGGFDSGCVAAIAASNPSVERLRPYSVVFPDHPETDEAGRIRELRAHLGLEGTEWRFEDGDSALSAAAEFIAAWGVPPSSPNGFVWRPLIRQAAADGNEILLDGNGGDELFGCSPYLLADLLLRGRLRSLLAMTRRLPGMGARPHRRLFQRALRLYLVRGAVPRRAQAAYRRRRERARGGPPWLAEESFERVLESEPVFPWKELPGPRWWAALVDSLVHVPDSLAAADELRREARLCGIRFAQPWRDPRLVEHMLGQPPELSFDPVHDRPLAREAMRGMMPDSVRLSEAKPLFNVLIQASLGGPDASLAEDLLTDPPDELAVHLRSEAIPKLLDERGSRTGALAVWRLATAALWLRSREDPDFLARFSR